MYFQLSTNIKTTNSLELNTNPDHYHFSPIGHLIIATSSAHLSIPISILPLKAKLKAARKLSTELVKMAKSMGNQSPGGLQLMALSSVSDTKYEIVHSKFESVSFHCGQKTNIDMTNIFENLSSRRKHSSQILPQSYHPSMSGNQILTDSLFNRKSASSPDDPLPNKPTENQIIEQVEAPITEEIDSSIPSSSPVDPNANTTTIRTEPERVTNLDMSLEALYGTIPEQSDNTIVEPDNQPDNTIVEPDNQPDNTIVEPNEPTTIPEFEDPYAANGSEFTNLFESDDPFYRDKRSVPINNSLTALGQLGIVLLKRSKRFIGTIVMSLLASLGVSTIFGAYDASQINTIKEAVNHITKEQSLIIHQVESNAKGIMMNRNKLASLENLTLKLADFATAESFKDNGVLVYMIMMAEYDRIEHELEQFMDIVESANNHLMHPSVLTKRGTEDAFAVIKGKAEVLGLTPVISSPQQLSQMSTHFHYTEFGLNLVVEIPLTANFNTFLLYQFHPLPIKLGGQVHVKIAPENRILAIGEPGQRGLSRYIELSLIDLARCRQLGKVYMCPEQRVVHKPNGHTCLYSLFIADHKTAEQACRVTLEEATEDEVVATSHNSFVYFAAEPSTYRYRCQNNSIISGHQLQGITDIVVPRDCRVETGSFILHSQNDLFHEIKPKQFRYALPVLTFLANNSLITNVLQAVKVMGQTKGAPEIDQNSIKEFLEQNKPVYLDPVPLTNFAIAALALSLILILICIVWVNKCKQTKNIRRATPRNRAKRIFEDEGNVTFLENLVAKRSDAQ